MSEQPQKPKRPPTGKCSVCGYGQCKYGSTKQTTRSNCAVPKTED